MMNPHQPDEWLTPQEACRRLGISVKTLHRYEARGLLNPIRTAGGHRRYSAARIEALVSGRPGAATE